MLDEKEFLAEINRKASEKRRLLRKRNRAVVSAAGLCVVLLAGVLLFRAQFPEIRLAKEKQTNHSTNETDAPNLSLGSNTDINDKRKDTLILSPEQTENGKFEIPALYFENQTSLFFTAKNCPRQEICSVELSEEKSVVTIRISYPKTAAKEAKTPFEIPLPRISPAAVFVLFTETEG